MGFGINLFGMRMYHRSILLGMYTDRFEILNQYGLDVCSNLLVSGELAGDKGW